MSAPTMTELDSFANSYGKGDAADDRRFNQEYARFVAAFWRDREARS